MSLSALYIVATPIGHLSDMTYRAVDVLMSVDCIAAEDTRHSRILLEHYQITTPMTALHGDNEQSKAQVLLARLREGQSIALISDAGTPLISDPGQYLVQIVREAGFRVIPIPGPSALIAAMSVAGLPSTSFTFVGFLPHKGRGREMMMRQHAMSAATIVFYESCHRIESFLVLAQRIFGADQPAVIARELTKQFETVLTGTIAELITHVTDDDHQRKGEFVILIQGLPPMDMPIDKQHVERVLSAALPTKSAAKLIAEITGDSQRAIYQRILNQKEQTS